MVELDRENGSLARKGGVVIGGENQIQLFFLARLHAADAVLKPVNQRAGAERQHKARSAAAIKGDALHRTDKVDADRVAHLCRAVGHHRLGRQLCHRLAEPLRHIGVGHRRDARDKHLDAEVFAELKIGRKVTLCKVKRRRRVFFPGGRRRIFGDNGLLGDGRRRRVRRHGRLRGGSCLRRRARRAFRRIGGRLGHARRRGYDIGRRRRIGRHGRFVTAAAAECKNKRCDERRIKNFFHSRPP